VRHGSVSDVRDILFYLRSRLYGDGHGRTYVGIHSGGFRRAVLLELSFRPDIRSNKVIAVFTNACGAALYLALYFSQPLPLVSVLYTLLGFIMPSLSTNIDTWILKTYADTPYVYGPIRSVGSLFYAVFMLFYGGLLLKYGYILMLWFGLSFVAVSMLLIVSLPDAPQRPKSETAPVKKHGVVGGVFLLMLAAMFISNISLTPVGSMIAVTLKKLHGSAADQAYFLCAHALLEFPMMLLTYKLAQFIKPVNRLFISCVTYTVALVYIVVTQTPSGIILASALLGVGYGLFLPALREYVFRRRPEGTRERHAGRYGYRRQQSVRSHRQYGRRYYRGRIREYRYCSTPRWSFRASAPRCSSC
jgi:hypothetical protein